MEQISLLPPPPEQRPEYRPVTHRTAEISTCGRYRYRLTREWDDSRPPATFVMLNPSTADADQDDATSRKCIRYAQRWGCGSLVIVNLYAYRATLPSSLPRGPAGISPAAVGPDNDGWLSQAALDSLDSGGALVAAWGAQAAEQRVADVLTLPGMNRLRCLGVTASGMPRHPLYVRDAAPLVDWTPGGAG